MGPGGGGAARAGKSTLTGTAEKGQAPGSKVVSDLVLNQGSKW